MKKVIISLAVILGVASAAYAFTPAEAPKEEAVALEHNHTHVHELNAEEGHPHEVSERQCRYQCSRCGKMLGFGGAPKNGEGGRCPDTSSGNHIWQVLECR